MTKLFIFSGSDKEQCFDFKGSSIYVGRSPDNDIQVVDITISRRHLKIFKKGDKYFVKDLRSRNGTYIDGNYISPDLESEVKEGAPIVIGMSVICLGKECLENVAPFMDSLDLPMGVTEESKVPAQHRSMTNRKNMELIRKINSILNESLDINEISGKILDDILNHLKRVDRGIIILLIGNASGEISELIISRSRKPGDDTAKKYSRLVVDRVIKHEKTVMISDVHNENEAELSDTLKLLKIGSLMCVPIFSGSKIRGVIYVDSLDNPNGFRKEDLSLLTNLSNLAAIAIDDALFYGSLEKKL
ncbi:FHA domain-containing protein [Thermodesulfobacteriota bacterium]